ncbi:lysosomal amino acid transporter 1 homolog isoform X3 [Delphinapterus leucas]|uniref:Lysosomal amino acid transporter 1 homolog isoform X3 n=1 Tax=Delphinapterus leucas TaxID=9749 RepID=A0A2Y9LDL2_DELLE|nr:lysosomal amino acid transporter 1 homolog isoform X3 [Delphinapterus leucas]
MVWRKLGSRNFSSCPNGSSQWIWDVFGECAWDVWDKASVGLGLISILCFAASTLPQYIKACKMGNMDQALSLWFLLGWIGGDSCNLIGSFLADQLPLQTYTAVYYVLADVLMLSLYFHYKFKKRPSLFPAEVDTGDLLLAVRLGDAGEHAVWAKRAAQKPRSRPERGQLCAAPPALARGQPGRPAARHHRSPYSSWYTGVPPPHQSASHSSPAEQDPDPGQAQDDGDLQMPHSGREKYGQ